MTDAPPLEPGPTWATQRLIAISLATLLLLEVPIAAVAAIPFSWVHRELGISLGSPATELAAWATLTLVAAIALAEGIARLARLRTRLPQRVPGRVLCGLGVAYALLIWLALFVLRTAARGDPLGASLDYALPALLRHVYTPARVLLLVGLARLLLAARSSPTAE